VIAVERARRHRVDIRDQPSAISCDSIERINRQLYPQDDGMFAAIDGETTTTSE
jgi:hypothetical protein